MKKLGIAVIHGEAKEDEEEDDGRASPPPPTLSNRVTSVGTVLPPLMCKEKPPISVVGDVGGRIAIMVCYEFLSAGFKFAVLVIKEEFREITYRISLNNVLPYILSSL